MKKETRVFNTEFHIETRDDKPVIFGHGAVFNSLSENLGGFREKIAPGAFDDVLTNDVRVLFNHDSNLVLARTKSKTAKLSVDERGLKFEFEPGEQSYSKDLLITMTRGDVDQCSFGFTVDSDGQTWDEDDDGRIVRTITKVKRLFDVSPVTFPAYPDTDVAKRSLDAWKESAKPKGEPIEYYDKMTELQEKF